MLGAIRIEMATRAITGTINGCGLTFKSKVTFDGAAMPFNLKPIGLIFEWSSIQSSPAITE